MATTETMQVLSSQKLLSQSIDCINKGMEFEKNKEKNNKDKSENNEHEIKDLKNQMK